MISPLILALLAQGTPIVTSPVPRATPFSRDKYDIGCDLRDVQTGKAYRIVLSQYGGVYQRRAGDSYGARTPTYVRFSRDETGIFGDDPVDLTAMRITPWQDDGPFEVAGAKGAKGGFTFYKTAPTMASYQNPATIAVTVRGGRFVRTVAPAQSIQEFLLFGSCKVAWSKQEASFADPAKNESKS